MARLDSTRQKLLKTRLDSSGNIPARAHLYQIYYIYIYFFRDTFDVFVEIFPCLLTDVTPVQNPGVFQIPLDTGGSLAVPERTRKVTIPSGKRKRQVFNELIFLRKNIS